MLSEISQRKMNTVCFHLYVESKILKKNERPKTQKQTQRYREQTSGCQKGEEWEEECNR